MKSIKEEANLNNKKILLRLDLNVPLLGDKITDTTRIDKILPTLNFLDLLCIPLRNFMKVFRYIAHSI